MVSLSNSHIRRCSVTTVAIVVLVSGTVLPSTAQAAKLNEGDWPVLGGNYAHSKVIPSDDASPKTIQYRSSVNNANQNSVGEYNISTSLSPIVSKDRIYYITTLQSASNFSDEGIMAFDLKTGQLIWNYRNPTRQTSVSNLTIDSDDNVYFGGVQGQAVGLYKLDRNGNLVYRDRCGNPFGTSTVSPEDVPIIDSLGNIVIQMSTTWAYLVCDPNDGHRLAWGGSTTAAGRRGYGAMDSKGDLYFNTFSSSLLRRLTYTGAGGLTEYYRQVWQAAETDRSTQFPILSPDNSIIVSQGRNGSAYVTDAETGRFLWKATTGTINIAVGISQSNVVYIADSWDDSSVNRGTSIIRAFEGKTGIELWRKRVNAESLESRTFVTDKANKLYYMDKTHGNVQENDKDPNSAFRFLALNSDGTDSWSYILPVDEDGGNRLAALNDGSIFFNTSAAFYKTRPWHAELVGATRTHAGAGQKFHFTARSTMLDHDPLSDQKNLMQVRLKSGQIIPLTYEKTENEQSVWSDDLTLPSALGADNLALEGTLEAAAYMTTTSTQTHFTYLPAGFNNSGLSIPFNLGSGSGVSAHTDGFSFNRLMGVSWVKLNQFLDWLAS